MAKQKPKEESKPKRREYLGLLLLFLVAAALIVVGYLQITKQRVAPVNSTVEEVVGRNTTSVGNISQALPSDGCPLYRSDTPEQFNFQILHKDKSENPDLLYSLQYRCDCGPDCNVVCGMNYTDITGSVTVPVIRFSDADVMDLIVQGQVRETFPLKCAQSQTIIYLTDERCEFSYSCSFFGKLMADRLTYQALNSYTCDAITRSCDTIKIPE